MAVTKRPGTSKARTKARVQLHEADDRDDKRGSVALWAQALLTAAESQGMTQDQLCEELGISGGYLSKLFRGGGNNQQRVSRFLMEKSAEIMKTNVLTVHLLLGLISLEDFYIGADAATRADTAFSKMLADVDWAPYLPTAKEWDELSTKSKLGICYLYQSASRNMLEDLVTTTDVNLLNQASAKVAAKR